MFSIIIEHQLDLQYSLPVAAVQFFGCSRTICRMRQYRSPDAPVQITGCASTDHRMRSFQDGNAAGSDREVVEKNEKYRQHQRIKLD